MNAKDVRDRVRNILRASVIDADRGAEMEDELYFDLMNAIGTGACEDPKACAAEAVKTRGVTLRRSRS